MNMGSIVVMTPKEFASLRRELAIMQREVLQGGPWRASVGILASIVSMAVPTNIAEDDHHVNRLIEAD